MVGPRTLTPGMSYQVADNAELIAHQPSTGLSFLLLINVFKRQVDSFKPQEKACYLSLAA